MKKWQNMDLHDQIMLVLNKINLKFFAFNLERILFQLLLFPLSLKLRNIFEKKKKLFEILKTYY